MALKQDKAKLKRLINQKDRTEFIQEFIKFKNTYFNGNFKQASIAIGESREKVGGIFDRAGVPQGVSDRDWETYVFLNLINS